MKYIAIAIAAVCVFSTCSQASPICMPGTLSTYEALGPAGCSIGTNTVSGFNSPTGITGATPIAPGSVAISPSGGDADPTLTFTTSMNAANGVIFEALIDYSISGNQYTSDSIAATGLSSSGNGAVTEIQNYCLGGSFDATGVNNCSSGQTGDLLLLGDGSDSVSFAAVASLNVTHDFTLDSGGAGAGNSAQGGTIVDSYVATASSPVPEPSTLWLISASLACGVLLKRFTVGSVKGMRQ